MGNSKSISTEDINNLKNFIRDEIKKELKENHNEYRGPIGLQGRQGIEGPMGPRGFQGEMGHPVPPGEIKYISNQEIPQPVIYGPKI